jgi:hypothetical protein
MLAEQLLLMILLPSRIWKFPPLATKKDIVCHGEPVRWVLWLTIKSALPVVFKFYFH